MAKPLDVKKPLASPTRHWKAFPISYPNMPLENPLPTLTYHWKTLSLPYHNTGTPFSYPILPKHWKTPSLPATSADNVTRNGVRSYYTMISAMIVQCISNKY